MQTNMKLNDWEDGVFYLLVLHKSDQLFYYTVTSIDQIPII